MSCFNLEKKQRENVKAIYIKNLCIELVFALGDYLIQLNFT